MSPDEEPSASPPPSSLIKALCDALDQATVYETLLDGVVPSYVRGDVDVAGLADQSHGGALFALINTLRYADLPLDEEEQRHVGPERMKILRRLHQKYFLVLEDLFDAVVDRNLYGIENSWSNVYSQPIYHPDDKQLFMRLDIAWGPRITYHAVDRIDDFIRLGATILERCQRVLRQTAVGQLKLDDSQRRLIHRDIERVEEVSGEMAELRRAFQEGPAKPSGEKGGEASHLAEE